MIYLIAVILILAGIIRYDYLQAERGRLFYYCFLLVLFICVAGFRYRLGMDSVTYEHFFNSRNNHVVSELRWSDFAHIRYMPAFVIVASICRTITPDFMLLQFVISTFLNCVVFWFLWRNTKHVFFALLLYAGFEYITLNMEVLREALAVSFFLLSYPYLRDNKWLNYYIFALLAFLCHVSAYIMFIIPVCFLPGVKWFFQFGRRTFFISVFILAISVFISLWFYRFIQAIAITESMVERSNAYENMSIGGNVVNAFGIISNIVRFVIYPILAIYFLRKNNPELMETRDMQRKQTICILGIYIVLLSTGIFILTRYNNYLIFFSFILISDWVFSLFKEKTRKVRLNFLTWVFIFTPLFIYNTYSLYFIDINKSGTLKSYMKYYPYANRFDQQRDKEREETFRYLRRLY